GGGGPGIGFSLEEAAAINCATTLTVAVGALLAARFQLARLIATDRVELVRQPSRRQRRKALRGGATAEALTGHDATDPGATSRTVTGNPVLWRELRQPLFGSTWKRWLGIAAVVVAVGTIHATTMNAMRYETIAVVLVPAIGALMLLLLSAAAVPAGSITTELEARTWATLLTTPLRTHQILLPKVAGALRRLWPPFLFVTLHLIVCIARGIAPATVLALTFAHFAVFAAFLSCTGVFFSLCSRKSAVASTLNLSLALTLWLLGPILFGLVVALLTRGGGGDDAFGYFFFSNPAMSYGAAVVGLCEGNSRYEIGPLTLSRSGFFLLWNISLGTFLLAACGVLAFAGRHFHRLSTARI
ncbi:MAG: ABC transporter permease subunit, partial [Phycisphaerales bacterium]|nr:ABC transporter permease subunit [Phycisphaerales bacterium]